MNELQLQMSQLIQDIFHNENEDVEEYYGVCINVYKDIDKYLNQLENVKDQIFLAQFCNNYNKVNELIGKLSLSDYEKNKYLQLKAKNSELDQTINFKILSEKYSFLDNIMDMITTDINIQDQILSLSDNGLKLFEKMYLKLQSLTDYYNPYIATILQKIGYVSLARSWQNKYHFYDNLLNDIYTRMNDGYELSNEETNTLLYLCTSSIQHNIPNFNEFEKFGDDDSIDSIETQQAINKAIEEKNLKELKFAILAKAYGIHLETAETICKRYDISNIEITNKNKDVFEMYMAIYQIVNETDPNVLIELYHEFTKDINPKKDFRRTIVFENDLRKVFAEHLNNQVFKTDDFPYEEISGVKVYDADVNFKMIVTAIGAYQNDFSDKENYSEYWNSPLIRSHGNCCSLIGNTNLSMANVKNVIFGFSTMSDNMLLLSGNTDINSTPDSRNFNTTQNRTQRYMDSDSMLNNTRSDYNELVYERRDLSSNPKFYKKNPDYIVFIEEYEDFDKVIERFKNNPKSLEYLQVQKAVQDRLWKEAMKAANDFNIPIVKINREKVARSEINKIENLVNEFKETKNSALINQIITLFENSRVGNAGLHDPIRESFFSKQKMDNFLSEIKNSIEEIQDESIKNELFASLYQAILEEKKKVDSCKYKRNKNQISGIDFTKELTEIEKTLEERNIDYNFIGRKK